MALTERYVTSGAAGGGAGTSGSPWTFAEAITNAVAGDRINVQSDAAYSIGATTFPTTGTFAAPVIWRGYDSTIGDCDNLGRNSDGTLNTTGMPAITVTGILALTPYTCLQSLNITGALSSVLVGGALYDNIMVISCRIENTQSNANARALQLDDDSCVVNSDIVCSGTTSDCCFDSDNRIRLIDCRFEITSTAACLEAQSIGIAGCVFIKNGTLGGSGIFLNVNMSVSVVNSISNCTFYNFTNAILMTASHTGGLIVGVNNHVTDCTQYVNNTTNIAFYDIRNRTRDNTSPPSTVELITVGAITTDTGGASTDFVDAANGDLHLITTAPGYNAGWNGGDIGGLQTDPPAAVGASGGFIIGG